MDIHKPKHPIDSAREFLLEIFTVTVGICIALGLEAMIQARQEQQLRRHAQQYFTAELTANRDLLKGLIQRDVADENLLGALIEYGTAKLSHMPTTYKLPADVSRGFTYLTSDAWQTALATQAVGQLPFAQTRALSLVYDQQISFNDMEAKARDQWISIAAFGDPANLTDDEVRAALKLLRVSFAYQNSVAHAAKDMLPNYAAALKALPGS